MRTESCPAGSQEGFVLIIASVLLFLALAVGMNMLFTSNLDIQTAGSERRQAEVYFSADGALSMISQEIRDGGLDQFVVTAVHAGGSGNFTVEWKGRDVFAPGGTQAVGGSRWNKVPEELEGAVRILADRADRGNTGTGVYKLNLAQPVSAYAVVYQGIAPPAWTSSWDSTQLEAKDMDGQAYRIYHKALPAGPVSFSAEGDSSGRGIAYAFVRTPNVLGQGSDSVAFRLWQLDPQHVRVSTMGFHSRGGKRLYTTRLSRVVGLMGEADTVLFFAATMDVRGSMYFGRFSHEWSGMPPILTGDFYTDGDVVLDHPGSGGVAYFGYDLDNADGNGDPRNGIEAVNAAGVQETARFFTPSGQLTAGPNLVATDHVWVNTSRTGHQSRNFATTNTPPYDYLVTGITGANPQRMPGFTSAADIIADRALKDSAVARGVYINGIGTGITESWFFDWNVRKKAMIWEVDLAALPTSGSFNGFIYIERTGSLAADEFYGVKIVNAEFPISAVLRDQKGRIVELNGIPRKGLTIATPHALYTSGSVNTGSPRVDMALIGDSYTLLSKSWVDSLSRWSLGDNVQRERSLYLHNQHWAYNGTGTSCTENDLGCSPLNKGQCAIHFAANGMSDVADLITNWYFFDRNGLPLRREPRNDPAGASSTNQWNHFDETRVNAVVVTGFSLPTDFEPPTSSLCVNNPNKCVKSSNPGTYDKTLIRYSDAIRFLESWQGRDAAASQWNHRVRFEGSLNLMWEAGERGIGWGTSLEDNQELVLRSPLHTRSDWLEEASYSAHYCLGRQFKIGTSSLPEILFVHQAFMPPGFVEIQDGLPPSQTVGGWRRDAGVLD